MIISVAFGIFSKNVFEEYQADEFKGRFKRTGAILGILSNKGKGNVTVTAESINLDFDKGETLEIKFSDIKRFSFNWRNDLWAFRLNNRQKYVLQMGSILNNAIGYGLKTHQVNGFSL